jgi:hypothetical protein
MLSALVALRPRRSGLWVAAAVAAGLAAAALWLWR